MHEVSPRRGDDPTGGKSPPILPIPPSLDVGKAHESRQVFRHDLSGIAQRLTVHVQSHGMQRSKALMLSSESALWDSHGGRWTDMEKDLKQRQRYCNYAERH